MYVLLIECVYVRTYIHTYVRDTVRLRLRHLYQVEFCSFIVKYHRGHPCTLDTFLVVFLFVLVLLIYSLFISSRVNRLICLDAEFSVISVRRELFVTCR